MVCIGGGTSVVPLLMGGARVGGVWDKSCVSVIES